jgi:hypothetical protein
VRALLLNCVCALPPPPPLPPLPPLLPPLPPPLLRPLLPPPLPPPLPPLLPPLPPAPLPPLLPPLPPPPLHRTRVAGLLAAPCPEPLSPPSAMSLAKLNTLRLLLVWTLHRQVGNRLCGN